MQDSKATLGQVPSPCQYLFAYKCNQNYKPLKKSSSGIPSVLAILNKVEMVGRRRPNIGGMFKNRFYVGEIVDKETGTIYPHQYEQFVPYELFCQVQDVIEGHGKKKIKYAGIPHTYRGLMHCKTCGCAITAEIKTKKQKNGNVHHYTYYHCTGKRGKHKNMEWLEEREIANMIAPLFDECQVSEDELPRIVDTLKEAHGGKIKFNREQTRPPTILPRLPSSRNASKARMKTSSMVVLLGKNMTN